MGFPGNSFQSYPTREEAEEAFQEFRRDEEIMLVRTVKLEAERGEVERSSDVQVEEISTSDGVYQEAMRTGLLVACIVVVVALLIKLLL